jgi:hypothetical protein
VRADNRGDCTGISGHTGDPRAAHRTGEAVIRDKTIPYQVPSPQELPARLGAVLQVVYLVFNEGYSAESTRAELSREAIRLGRQERIVCALQKAKPAIREGNQNPLGLELLSAAAERGNYPEAKPNRDGLKGRRACKDAEPYRSFDATPITERSLTQIGPLPHRRASDRLKTE